MEFVELPPDAINTIYSFADDRSIENLYKIFQSNYLLKLVVFRALSINQRKHDRYIQSQFSEAYLICQPGYQTILKYIPRVKILTLGNDLKVETLAIVPYYSRSYDITHTRNVNRATTPNANTLRSTTLSTYKLAQVLFEHNTLLYPSDLCSQTTSLGVFALVAYESLRWSRTLSGAFGICYCSMAHIYRPYINGIDYIGRIYLRSEEELTDVESYTVCVMNCYTTVYESKLIRSHTLIPDILKTLHFIKTSRRTSDYSCPIKQAMKDEIRDMSRYYWYECTYSSILPVTHWLSVTVKLLKDGVASDKGTNLRAELIYSDRFESITERVNQHAQNMYKMTPDDILKHLTDYKTHDTQAIRQFAENMLI
jgi:hypothetical protein